MAEVLAVVASGVAMVQVASQLGSNIAKLKSLLDDMKDVPQMIRHLVQELDVLVPLIKEVEMIRTDFPLGTSSDATLQLCIQHCRTSSQAIADMATSLSRDIDSAKRRAKISASLKIIQRKQTLARLERELAGTMRLLMLAQQFYMIAVFRHNQGILASIVDSRGSLKPDDQPAGHRSDTDSQQIADAEAIKKPRTAVTDDKLGYLPRNWRSQVLGLTIGVQWATGTYHMQLVCPRWVASCAWDLQVSRASSGWRVAIKSRPVRANDSKPFVYIRDGNMNGLLESFNIGEASPFDQDVNGWSLVHHAALYQQYECCYKLFEMGVDMNERTQSQMTVLRCLNSSDPFTNLDQSRTDLFKFILSRGGDYELYEGEPPEQQLGAPYHGTAESFLLLQSHLFPHYYDDSLQTRLLCAMQIALNPWRAGKEFRVSLQRHGEISAQDAVKSMDCHLPILNIALLGLNIRLQSAEAAHDVPEWQELVDLILVQSKAALDALPLSSLDTSHIRFACTGQLERATPLICVVMGTLKAVGHIESSWELVVGNAVQMWAETIQRTGMNVERYIRAEETFFENESRHNWFHLGKRRRITGLARLERVSLSPSPEDWGLTWDRYLRIDAGQGDIFAGSVPGAWVEDNLPKKRCSCH